MRRLLKIGVLAAVLAAIGTVEAEAQSIKTFMLIPGIPGSSVEVGRVGWIDVLSMSQGVSSIKRSVACSDLSIMKVLDQAGPALWAAAATRQLFPEVRIEVVRGVTSPSPFVTYDIRLINARVTSSQTSGSGEVPFESVSFSYDSVSLTFNGQSADGSVIPGTPQLITCQ